MHDEWKQFLTKSGAVFEGEQISTFGKVERERQIATSGLIIADLSHLGHISLSGDDARDFLQGQVTCDLNQVSSSMSSLGAHCNQKGRVVSLFRLFQHNDRILLRTPRNNLANAETFLKKFSIFSKVLIENVSSEWVTIGLSGSNASEHIEVVLGTAPKNMNEQTAQGNVSVIRIPGVTERFELCGPIPDIIQVWEKLDVHAAPVGPNAWAIQDLLIGMPEVTHRLSEGFLPQSLDLLHWNVVSFDKGCYLGQEVVARLHYKGDVKRVLQGFSAQGATLPSVGDELVDSKDKSLGTVLNAQWLPAGAIQILAVVKRLEDEQPVYCASIPGQALKVTPFTRNEVR